MVIAVEDSENSDYGEDEFENGFNQIENDEFESSESEQDHTSQAEINLQPTIQDLQSETAFLKEEIREIKARQELDRLILKQISSSPNVPKTSDPIDDGEEQGDFINFLSRISIRRWHMRVTLVVNKSFILHIVALFDIGADLNCVQEGLIPTKFFEKTKEALRAAKDNKLGISYKLSDVEIRTSIGVSILSNSTSFVLVKDITNPVILDYFGPYE
ncbi:hypothetical protein KY284_005219 [Solanum tuberosum]|nr:hypothetical protein KY284_005219 [Solanum tuberosum]